MELPRTAPYKCGKSPKKQIYVVYAGKNPGIYEKLEDIAEQIVGYEYTRYEGFGSYVEAEDAWYRHLNRVAMLNIGVNHGKERSSGSSPSHPRIHYRYNNGYSIFFKINICYLTILLYINYYIF